MIIRRTISGFIDNTVFMKYYFLRGDTGSFFLKPKKNVREEGAE